MKKEYRQLINLIVEIDQIERLHKTQRLSVSRSISIDVTPDVMTQLSQVLESKKQSLIDQVNLLWIVPEQPE